MIPSPAAALRDVGFCLGFFTRLPVPAFVHEGRSLAQAIWAAPLAGLLVGVVGAAIFFLADLSHLSPGVSAALALAAMMAVTGCLHEDGLSDTVDGFGGGRTRDHRLDIMRDSRIGSFGAAALCLSILIRWSALQDLAAPVPVMLALVAAHAASRALLPAFMRLLPPARPAGLSAGVGAVGWPVVSIALAIGVVSLAVLGLVAMLSGAVLLFAVFTSFRLLCLRRIGGQTGDTLGALQQFAETTILLVASAFL